MKMSTSKSLVMVAVYYWGALSSASFGSLFVWLHVQHGGADCKCEHRESEGGGERCDVLLPICINEMCVARTKHKN
jgi:hypothetical protein